MLNVEVDVSDTDHPCGIRLQFWQSGYTGDQIGCAATDIRDRTVMGTMYEDQAAIGACRLELQAYRFEPTNRGNQRIMLQRNCAIVFAIYANEHVDGRASLVGTDSTLLP